VRKTVNLAVLVFAAALVASCGGDGGSGDEARFVNCGNGTVEDRETGLLWEEKTGVPSHLVVTCVTADGGCEDPHDVNNRYAWSVTVTLGAPDGAAFTDFLARLNGRFGTAPCLADHCDWDLPSVSQLQTIIVGPGVESSVAVLPPDPDAGLNPTAQSTTCVDVPCIDPNFSEIGGPTATGTYWSASSDATRTDGAWVWFSNNGIVPNSGLFKTAALFVRAVRAGSCTD